MSILPCPQGSYSRFSMKDIIPTIQWEQSLPIFVPKTYRFCIFEKGAHDLGLRHVQCKRNIKAT